jgi:hypothetical protein
MAKSVRSKIKKKWRTERRKQYEPYYKQQLEKLSSKLEQVVKSQDEAMGKHL